MVKLALIVIFFCKEAESSGSEDSLDEKNLSMKGEQVDIVEGTSQVGPVFLIVLHILLTGGMHGITDFSGYRIR